MIRVNLETILKTLETNTEIRLGSVTIFKDPPQTNQEFLAAGNPQSYTAVPE